MSFDLYFYTAGDRILSEKEIADYLIAHKCVQEDEFPQWIYTNDSTGVYFLFERQDESEDPEDIELFESFDGFSNTRFTFNLNFVRPNFFGLEAFGFVARFMSELDLYALNPQTKNKSEFPRKETTEEYYADWSTPNLNFSSEYFDDLGLVYFPLERLNQFWRHNFHKDEMQERLGDDYFVPSLILVRRASTGEPVTITTWTQHIPTVIPPADFFMIMRKRKKLFRTIEEKGLISRDTFLQTFAEYMEPFEVEGTFIIHPDRAAAAGDQFNTIDFDHEFEGFFSEAFELEKLTNAERSPEQKSLDEN